MAATANDTELQPRTPGKRGIRIPPQGEGGYDQAWYPVCLADEVAAGKVLGCDLMNGRVVVFRDAAGAAHVTSAYCRHVGASLEVGDVIDGRVRCAFHHWEYDGDGRCVKTGCGDEPPATARLFKFPTLERWGLIWAFNGEEPLYEIPHFPVPDDELTWHTSRCLLLNADPFVVLSNSMDFQHLITVHGAKIATRTEDIHVGRFSMWYDQDMTMPGLGEIQQRIRIFAANCITLSGTMMGRETYQMAACCPLPGNRAQIYQVCATRKPGEKPGEAQMVPQLIKTMEDFGLRLMAEDKPVMDTIRFAWDHLTKSDAALSMYMHYVRKLPRSDVAGPFIT